MKNQISVYIFFLLLSINCIAQKSNEDGDNLVQTILEGYLDLEGTPPGISIAISKDNEIVFAKGFGFSDLSKKKHVTVETQFRTASVSKLITVTALARLIQEKRIDINTPISDYFKSIPKEYSKITAKQSAGHIGGVTHYSAVDRIENRFYNSVDDALGVFLHIKPLSKPGSQYQYSTYGYVLLSKVIEEVAGEPFLDYMNNQLFSVLNMYSTGPELMALPSKNMTKVYAVYENGINKGYAFNKGYQEDPSYKWAGGGFISTPTDLVKMSNAYTNGFFRQDVLDLMFESQKLNSGKKTGVGIGWRGSYDMANRRVYEHAGYQRGARSVLSIFPNEKLSIAILTNASNINRIEESAHMLALPYLTKPSPEEQPKGIMQLSVDILDYDENLTTEKATIVLDGENDRIIFNSENKNEIVYPLVYMNRDNIYALVQKDGILYTELKLVDDKLLGKVMRYRSPMLTPTYREKPFMQFEGFLNK